MTATMERTETMTRPAQTAIRRPASGITIDPGRLAWYRERLALSRQDLSDVVTRLGLIPGGISRDAIAKIENGARKPKARTVRALCQALSTPDAPVEPGDLMPGGPSLAPHAAAGERRARLDYNRELRAFANARGIPYKNDKTGRVYYSRHLREEYARDIAAQDAGDGESADEGSRALLAS